MIPTYIFDSMRNGIVKTYILAYIKVKHHLSFFHLFSPKLITISRRNGIDGSIVGGEKGAQSRVEVLV